MQHFNGNLAKEVARLTFFPVLGGQSGRLADTVRPHSLHDKAGLCYNYLKVLLWRH